jgi:hypothetical protein
LTQSVLDNVLTGVLGRVRAARDLLNSLGIGNKAETKAHACREASVSASPSRGL